MGFRYAWSDLPLIVLALVLLIPIFVHIGQMILEVLNN